MIRNHIYVYLHITYKHNKQVEKQTHLIISRAHGPVPMGLPVLRSACPPGRAGQSLSVSWDAAMEKSYKHHITNHKHITEITNQSSAKQRKSPTITKITNDSFKNHQTITNDKHQHITNENTNTSQTNHNKSSMNHQRTTAKSQNESPTTSQLRHNK